jgi:F-type H+-transporting ATPase subunit b
MSFRTSASEAAANPLIPHTAELIVGTIAFALLFFVLRSKVVPMFEKAFAARTEAIQGGMEKAEKAQRDAQVALEQYTAQLSDARGEAQKIREEARVQGAAIIEDLRGKAQEEAARIQPLTPPRARATTLQGRQRAHGRHRSVAALSDGVGCQPAH